MAETFEFKLTLVGTYWDLVPEYAIYCGNTLVCRQAIPSTTDTEHVETFTGSSKSLRVQFENKASDQSVLNLNRDRLIRDMLLEVRALTVNNIPVPVVQNCKYIFDQKQLYQGSVAKEIPHINVMGFNGVLEINIP
jgi:hypothetical protein